MQVTLDLDDELVEHAKALTGIHDTAILVQEGLRLLIGREAAKRLARMGGTQPGARAAPRRRLEPTK